MGLHRGKWGTLRYTEEGGEGTADSAGMCLPAREPRIWLQPPKLPARNGRNPSSQPLVENLHLDLTLPVSGKAREQIFCCLKPLGLE